MSNLYLLANILTFVCVLTVGPLSDKFKMHKMMTLVNIVVIISFLPAWYDLNKFDKDDTHCLGWYFDVGFVLIMGVPVCSFMLSITMIAKLCNEKTRGTMFTFNGLCGSISILLFQWMSGYLFDNVSIQIPFLIGFGSQVVYAILCLLFGSMGKLNV